MEISKADTYFVDIDGTIFKHRNYDEIKTSEAIVIKSTKQYLQQKKDEGSIIVLVTARTEDLRDHTIYELTKNNIPFDYLLMNLGRGVRFLINDLKPYWGSKKTAVSINLERDKGF